MRLLYCLLACLVIVAGMVVAEDVQANDTGDDGGGIVISPQDGGVPEVDMQNVTDEGNASTAAANSVAVQARYENVNYGYNKTLAAMDVVIEYLGNKTDVASLVELKGNFTSLFEGLQQYVDANDPSNFGKQVAEMHKVAARFKSETAKLAGPGDMGQVKKQMQDRLGQLENDTAMQEMKERTKALKANAYRIACGLNMIRVQKLKQSLEAQNISADELGIVKERIREACANMSANATDIEQIAGRIREKFSDAKAKMVSHVKFANEKALENAIAVVSALENKGMNVSGARERLIDIQTLRNETREACANLTSSDCIDKIKELRNETQSLRDDIKVVVRENSSGAGKRK